jgi:hypothetical protein
MKLWWAIGGGSVVAGVVIGGSIVWYLHAHRDEAVVASRGGSVQLSQDAAERSGSALGEMADDGAASGSSAAPSPTPLPLRVTGTNEGSTQGAGQSVLGQTDGEPARLPEPSEFEVYEQYASSNTAMYQDVTPGTGPEATSGKTAVVHYRGWLTDGRLFDESYARKQPYSFALGSGQVIAGWDQGIYGMKVGGKRRLVVPPSAGYGSQEHNGIPANSVLVFEVELLEVK